MPEGEFFGSSEEVIPPYTEDLPVGFDPTSDEQVRALTNGQLRGSVAEAVGEVIAGSGDVSDIAWAMVPEEGTFLEDADPQAVVLTNSLLRELVRRAISNPALDLTPEYLFGEKNG